ncbi:MAG: hypothetical protein AB3N19_04765, partial [Ruegeria sp.]
EKIEKEKDGYENCVVKLTSVGRRVMRQERLLWIQQDGVENRQDQPETHHVNEHNEQQRQPRKVHNNDLQKVFELSGTKCPTKGQIVEITLWPQSDVLGPMLLVRVICVQLGRRTGMQERPVSAVALRHVGLPHPI